MEISKYIQGDDTAELLQKISRRLSGRTDCKDVEFKVVINDDSRVSLMPLTYVFPDTHHRAQVDKLLITDYIMQQLSSCKLSAGTYKYQKVNTSSRKRRRWVKL